MIIHSNQVILQGYGNDQEKASGRPGGRGIGTEIAKAAIAAGHSVIATGRDPDAVSRAVRQAANLVVMKLDITEEDQADAVAKSAIERFLPENLAANEPIVDS
ncbi:MAG TPA: SDR family NAD(P)-dependent oxidoreductase [Oligoflexus sp.]|uniref:SDR family NAD(P)-dependent oxidoreductase n=1 Tax=Oligoflexus sp. TaxID=1971216 RepID=UPI002D580E1A|nr:SDR family NAD(P)-dependent oxidoreductase [Oligoflexus sp.]HYX33717.1 SDR family NAD(P)-dependent oxidoreductase [Oligoflexus sp.]